MKHRRKSWASWFPIKPKLPVSQAAGMYDRSGITAQQKAYEYANRHNNIGYMARPREEGKAL